MAYSQKGRSLGNFLAGLREQLEKYNQRNPSGRKIPPPIQPDATTSSHPAPKVLSPLPLPEPVTPVAGSSRMPLREAGPSMTWPPMPVASPSKNQSPMPVASLARMRSPMPVAGFSRHWSQTPETTEDKRLKKKKSKDKAPIPVVRIPWCLLPMCVAKPYI